MANIAVLTAVMSFLDRHPALVRALRPVANAPLLSRRMKVLTRAYLGATAFEIHDVNLDHGRIGIGGVDEFLWSSKFIQLFHEVLGASMGQEEKNRALYEVGHRGGHWEIAEAIKHGRWAPADLVELIEQGGVIDRVRADPAFARFFTLSMKMALRLIINEGGWGVTTMDLESSPIKVYLEHSKEAAWVGPAEVPVCHLSAGVIAGYTSRLVGERLDAVEVRCKAQGHPRCVSEIDR